MATTKKPAKPKAPKAEAAEPTLESITLDPSLPLLRGNSVSFVAADKPGRVMAKVSTSSMSMLVMPSRNGGQARVSRILERPGDITVSFMENGKVYAEGTWTIS